MKKNLFIAILLFIFSSLTITAQSIEDNINSVKNIFTDIKTRSIEMERMKREANKRPEKEYSAVNFPEIKEDFEQIQKINILQLQPNAAERKINYKSVSKYASQINDHAERLYKNLFPFNKEDNLDDNPQDFENTDINVLLKSLDDSITDFVHSPIFKNLSVVNLQESQKAQKDLNAIIKTSLAIKEKSKLLRENSK